MPASRPAPSRRRAHRLALLLLLLLPACTYFDRRMADLHDCFLYRWHQDGLGIAVDAKVALAEATLGGWYSAQGWGKDTWWQTPGDLLTNHGTGVPFTTLGPLFYRQPWSRLFATSTWGNHPGAPDAFDDVGSWFGIDDVFDLDDNLPFRWSPPRRIADAFGIEAGVYPLFWGVHVGFNPVEFADLLLGFAGIDLLGDDGRPRPPTLPMLPGSADSR